MRTECPIEVPSHLSQINPYVLVVEEARELRAVLVRALRHRGVAARGVARCEEVMRLLEAHDRPGALLVSCPGAVRCALLRDDPRLSSLAGVPVVAMTSSSRDPGCQCVRACLPKPFGVRRLLATLRQACGA